MSPWETSDLRGDDVMGQISDLPLSDEDADAEVERRKRERGRLGFTGEAA